MCGIAGIVGAQSTDLAALHRMAEAMVRRGPDAQGVWHDDQVGLAFRRLAIIDLEERSNQPLHLGQLHLVFNGEIYNYIELRETLCGAGHRFVTEGDAEVLLHAWAEWGEDALDRLNGMFAFAVWDGAAARLTLAVDRFAEKPLLFHRTRDGLLFGSDVRALRAVDPRVGVPDEDATARFLAIGTMPTLPATFFTDVQRIPGAHVATWSIQDGLRMRRWWNPRVIEVPREPITAASRLRELLTDAVALRLRSDVPVGSSLSGGVDSSAIVMIAADLAGDHSRHAFTATFPGFARDEWPYASAVAASAGVVEHRAVEPRVEQLLEDLPEFVATQEEPFASTSIYAQWRVMRAAREAGIAVMLDGQGADELFGGYPGSGGWALRSMGAFDACRAVIHDRGLLEQVAIAYSAGRAPKSIVHRHRLRLASPYVDPTVAWDAVRHEPPPPDWAVTGSPIRRELLMQAFRTSLPQLCRFADRDSMAFSVEVRLPFLDVHVAEFALSLDARLLWRDGMTKRILRDSVRDIVPDVVLDRRDKIGYETPEAVWFSSDIARAHLREVLIGGSVLRWCSRAEIEGDLSAGRWRDPTAIWRALNVELWLTTSGTAPTLSERLPFTAG